MQGPGAENVPHRFVEIVRGGVVPDRGTRAATTLPLGNMDAVVVVAPDIAPPT
jgi:hypothetical protein